jgi:hypothetical protein
MTPEEVEAVRTACAELCAEAAKGIERDPISIATVVERGD